MILVPYIRVPFSNNITPSLRMTVFLKGHNDQLIDEQKKKILTCSFVVTETFLAAEVFRVSTTSYTSVSNLGTH
jgi:hypothetical protein